MIDLLIWKEKLEQDVRILRKRLNQRRWTERSVVLFERDLMLTFFGIRALIEAGKLTDRTSHREYNFVTYPSKGMIVDDFTKSNIDEVFDFYSGIEKKLSLKLLTHQFVHAYVVFTEFSEGGNVIGVLLCSDREKYNVLIQIPISLAIEIIEGVIADEIQSEQFERSDKSGELRKTKIL